MLLRSQLFAPAADTKARRAFRRGDRYAIAALVAALVVAALVVDPRGNFPLNDDWSFATSARRLVLEHDWRPSFWGNMSLVTQSLSAWPLCYVGACSYEGLRASTFVAAVVLLVVVHRGMRLVGASLFQASVGAVITVFNPVLFELSFTFMTDVFFAVVTCGAALALCLRLQTGSRLMGVLGTALAVTSILCRQLGLCLPLAFAVASLCSSERRWRSIAASVLPALIGAAALLIYEGWMNRTGRTPGLYYVKNEQLLEFLKQPALLAHNVFLNGAIVALYMGLFIAPLTLTLKLPAPTIDVRRGPRWLPSAVASIVTATVLSVDTIAFGPMPIKGNILVPQGLGPLTLRDVHLLHLPHIPPLPLPFWDLVTAISAVGLFRLSYVAAVFAQRVLGRGHTKLDKKNAVALFLLLSVGIYYAPLLPANVFERYTAVVMPLLCFFYMRVAVCDGNDVSPRGAARSLVVPAILAACMVVFAVTGTHDYMSWNRARWRAIALLTDSGPANAANLDGGFEYNGAAFDIDPHPVSADKSWWWVADDRYLISFGAVDGYRQVAAVPYRNYLPPARRYVYALERR